MATVARIVVLLLTMAAGAGAQIKLGLDVQPATILQYEPVVARLTIFNNTGEPLRLGTNGNCKLRYIVRDNTGVPASRLTPDAIAWHPAVIAPSMLLVVTNVLNDLYRLSVAGAYTVEVELEWGDLVFSPKKTFLDVVPGITVMEFDAGAPSGQGVRRYQLKVLSRDRQDHLFLRMEDRAGGVCYGVFDLGRFIRMEAPTYRVAADGLVHVLHQSGPYEHTHTVLSPQGRVEQRDVYGGEYKIVRLKTMQDGAVIVNESQTLERKLAKPPKDFVEGAPVGWRGQNKKE